ncbi:MAG TPA: polyphosphate kinase 1 [Ruminiclostridium sp.]
MDKLKNAVEDREISWLRYNERVLEEAQYKKNPLYERLHFISIFCNNLDEFFMIRDGTLIDTYNFEKNAGYKKEKKETKEKLKSISKFTKELLAKKDLVYAEIMQQLQVNSFNQITAENITDDEHNYLRVYFEKQISPVLSPVIIDKKQRFPFVKNKQMIVATSFESKDDPKMGIVPIQTTLPSIIFIPNTGILTFILVEDLICMFIEGIFKKHTVSDKAIIRITRNADIDDDEVLCDDDIDSNESMMQLIKIRAKMAPVRMECIGNFENRAIIDIRKALDLDKNQVFCQSSPLDMSFIQELKVKIPQQTNSTLYYLPLTPQKLPQIDENEPMINQIMRKDILLAYPFEDISQFIKLIDEAGIDNRVQSIKITIFRAAENSKIIDSLIKAAKNGKEVICVVELRARFDETENIGWAKKLENGGCKVVYGLPEFKVHSKIMLITLNNDNQQEYITQIGTGNYNETTSMVYCDLSLITAHQEIGAECAAVFEKLQEGKFIESTKHLLVAPLCFENRIVELIDDEIAKAKDGKNASITLKFNGLSDKSLIKKLIEASQCGVKIQFIIRDVCCLKAGVEGITENINVRSIVGRFLEHSRIYKFGEGSDSCVYISSADFMKRNTAHRVEIAVPIYDADCKEKVCHMLDMMLKDNMKARIQMPDGQYDLTQKGDTDKEIDYQVEVFNEAICKNNQ